MPGGEAVLTVASCILWENKDDLSGFTSAQINYCCIKDPNDSGTGVTHADPNFAYKDPNYCNYHVQEGSPCVDRGNPSGPTGETDIDGEDRVVYGKDSVRVDMGADEYQDCDTGVWHPADFNADGIINLPDFATFAQAWLSTPADPNHWNPACDFNRNNVVNAADLAVIAEDWLWMACWRWITPARQQGDWNTDGIVNLIDYAALANAWLSSSGGPRWNALCDLNRDNLVNLPDLAYFAEDWLMITCPTLAPEGMGMAMGAGRSPQKTTLPPHEVDLPKLIGQLTTIADHMETMRATSETLSKRVSESTWADTIAQLRQSVANLQARLALEIASQPVPRYSLKETISLLETSLAHMATMREKSETFRKKVSDADWSRLMESMKASLEQLRSQTAPAETVLEK